MAGRKWGNHLGWGIWLSVGDRRSKPSEKLHSINENIYVRALPKFSQSMKGPESTHICNFEEAGEIGHHVPMAEHDSLRVSWVSRQKRDSITPAATITVMLGKDDGKDTEQKYLRILHNFLSWNMIHFNKRSLVTLLFRHKASSRTRGGTDYWNMEGTEQNVEWITKATLMCEMCKCNNFITLLDNMWHQHFTCENKL